MTVLLDADGSPSRMRYAIDDVAHLVRRIQPNPLDVPQPALPVFGIVAAVTRARLEGLSDVVGDEDPPARPAVDECGLEDGLQFRLGEDVRERVVHEDGVEDTVDPDASHIALDVLQLRVQPAAQLQHLRRAVDEREREVALEVRCVVASPTPELEHGLDGTVRMLDQHAPVELSLLRSPRAR